MIIKFALLLCLIGVVSSEADESCPRDADVLPCVCTEPMPGLSTLPSLYCNRAQTNEDLEQAFSVTFPQPKFDILSIDTYSNITHLTATAPQEVNFVNIILGNGPLESITAEFFSQFSEFLNEVLVYRTEITNETFPFDVIPQLTYLKQLTLRSNYKLTSLPRITSTSLIALSVEYTPDIESLQLGKLTSIQKLN